VEIVPDERLIVRPNVKPQDRESVHVGADAVVRLTGLNVQTTPRLKGKITYLSADALTDKEGRVSYYEARVSISEKELAKVKGVQITPGMPAEVLIDAGARTALDYLLQPVTLAFSHAFRE
ncbi:MAG: HlyD family efflux transporter periplasmic adaptor subunit, partial [Caulobacteraceae bacterium]